jgi:pimeloyl-ACP methyl ester carboxylesterase
MRHLARSLPEYMLPADVVRTENLPRNPNGKIDRLAIPAAGAPTAGAPITGAPPPAEKACFHTETERRLAAIWSRLLETAAPDRNDGFERFGGDSLTAMLLALEVESAFGKVVSPAELLRADTLEGQAKRVDGAEHRRIAAYNEGGRFPPLFFVHTANSGAEVYRNFLAALPAEQPFYVFENHNMLFSKGRFEGIRRLAERYAGYLPPRAHYRLGGWSLGGLVAFEMGLLLQQRGIPSDLYLVDPYVTASEEERARNAALEAEASYQDYLSRDALFERFREAGLMDRLIAHNRFIRGEIARYAPAGMFHGKVVLFRAMKADPADSEVLAGRGNICQYRPLRLRGRGRGGNHVLHGRGKRRHCLRRFRAAIQPP